MTEGAVGRFPVLPGLARLLGKTQRIGGAASEEELLRRELIKANNQYLSTQKIIKANETRLKGLSTENNNILQLLAAANDRSVETIAEKIVNRQEVSTKEAAKLVNQLKEVTEELDKIQVVLDADLSSVTDHLSTVALDTRLDRQTRREVLEDLQKITKNTLGSNKKSSAALDLLVELNTKQLNFTEDDNENLRYVLSELRNDTQNVKLNTTLADLNKSVENSVLTNEGLQDLLDTQTSGGRFEDFFLNHPDLISKGGATEGIISTILGSLGLGGISESFGLAGKATGLLSKGLGGIGRLGARGAGGLLKGLGAGGKAVGAAGAGIAGIAGSVGLGGALKGAGVFLKGGARLLGKIALPLQAALSVIDFAQGFSDAANIAGLEPGTEATLTQKVQAGVSSVISGLTFGFVSEKTIYQGITKVVDWIKDTAMFLWEQVESMWNTFLIRIGETVVEVRALILSSIEEFGKSLMTYIQDRVTAVKEAVLSFLGFETGTARTSTVTPSADSLPVEQISAGRQGRGDVGDQVADAVTKALQAQKQQARPGTPAVDQGRAPTAMRKNTIDDLGLAVEDSLLF